MQVKVQKRVENGTRWDPEFFATGVANHGKAILGACTTFDTITGTSSNIALNAASFLLDKSKVVTR